MIDTIKINPTEIEVENATEIEVEIVIGIEARTEKEIEVMTATEIETNLITIVLEEAEVEMGQEEKDKKNSMLLFMRYSFSFF